VRPTATAAFSCFLAVCSSTYRMSLGMESTADMRRVKCKFDTRFKTEEDEWTNGGRERKFEAGWGLPVRRAAAIAHC
jgi:hypothetical protein